ncbi:hypothetical protein FRC05_004369 [Tulasnella sp. 425]|nr:hypothetical protein FRC05_004369 [Tulasnella sp. 425]
MTTKWLRGSLLPFRNISHPKNQADGPEHRRIVLATRGTPLECQRSSKFAQLPEDILLLFLDHLDKTAKASVVRTCRYLRHLLEATLYIHLRSSKVERLHRTLAERPDLIPYIRSYTGPLVSHPIESPVQPMPKRTPGLLDFLQRWKVVESVRPLASPFAETEAFKNSVFIFSKATQIVDLYFTDGNDWASDPRFEPVKAAVFNMSLKRLSFWHGVVPTQILRAQPELEHLEIGWNVRWAEALDKADLPKLRSLKTTLKEASNIVPGRPVERLELIPMFTNNDFDPALFKNLILSTGPIKNLHIRMLSQFYAQSPQSPIRIASQTLPNLEQLIITHHGPIPEQLILDEIPSFQSLRRLVLLDLDLAKVAGYGAGVNDGDNLFRRVKILCPSLVGVERKSAWG